MSTLGRPITGVRRESGGEDGTVVTEAPATVASVVAAVVVAAVELTTVGEEEAVVVSVFALDNAATAGLVVHVDVQLLLVLVLVLDGFGWFWFWFWFRKARAAAIYRQISSPGKEMVVRRSRPLASTRSPLN